MRARLYSALALMLALAGGAGPAIAADNDLMSLFRSVCVTPGSDFHAMIAAAKPAGFADLAAPKPASLAEAQFFQRGEGPARRIAVIGYGDTPASDEISAQRVVTCMIMGSDDEATSGAVRTWIGLEPSRTTETDVEYYFTGKPGAFERLDDDTDAVLGPALRKHGTYWVMGVSKVNSPRKLTLTVSVPISAKLAGESR